MPSDFHNTSQPVTFQMPRYRDGDLDAHSPSPNSFKSSFLIQRLASQELMYLSSYAHGQTPGKILCSSQITKSLFSQQVAHLNRGSLSGEEVMGTKEGEGMQLGSRGPRGRSPTCNSKPAHLPHLLAFSFSVKAQSMSVEGGKGWTAIVAWAFLQEERAWTLQRIHK